MRLNDLIMYNMVITNYIILNKLYYNIFQRAYLALPASSS